MTDYFDEDELLLEAEDEFVEPGVGSPESVRPFSGFDARRKLENMLEERRLKDELEDFIDY